MITWRVPALLVGLGLPAIMFATGFAVGPWWPLLGVTVVHRYGRLEPGESIVLVVTAAAHRQEAFAAAEFLMDFLKTRAPFWKQVEYAGGKDWVDAKQSDDALADRWTGTGAGRAAAE